MPAPALSLRLCDDGNLHDHCSPELHDALPAAATEAHFVAGDTESCSTFTVAYVDNDRSA
ncbi:hypothetical protein GCM10023184_10190 [Flaviaesturariibacter amylovorans]|uniref:Uncharacterized protein n=1 Tax=Flaviaesturariibacter amylovorans TaxID=1084520 RepID=A0ABP8GFN0_9BACT